MKKNHLFIGMLCVAMIASVSFVPVAVKAQPTKSFQFLKKRADVSNLVKLVRRQKVQFKKLGWERPSGARGKNASDKVTFTNSRGEKISLAPEVAFAQLNKLEQKLNAGGYSSKTSQALEITATTKYDPSSMLRQQKLFRSGLVKGVTAKVLRMPTAMQNLRLKRGARGSKKFKRLGAMSKRFSVVKQLSKRGSRGKKTAKQSEFSKEWPKNYAWGKKKYVQMAVNGKLKVFGNSDKLTIRGEGKVTASAINKTTTVFSVVASLTGNNKTDTVSGSLTARVLGMDSPVIDKSFKKKTPKPIKDDWKKTLDWNVPIKIPIIWGISVKGEFGIRGKVGVEYALIVHPLRVSASFIPYTELSGYGQAGIAIGVFGIDLAEAGLGAELTFLKGNLEFHAEAGLSVENKTLYFDYNAFSRWDVEALRGVIYGYLKYWAPPCYNPFKKKCWKWVKKTKRANFWKSGALVNEEGFILGPYAKKIRITGEIDGATDAPSASAVPQGDVKPSGKRVEGYWGDWASGRPTKCPEGSAAVGFRQRVEKSQKKGDDTALNSIQLRCRGLGNQTKIIKSKEGFWGDWSTWKYCPHGHYIVSFRMRVEKKQGKGDDTGANDVQFTCSNGKNLIANKRGGWGSWRKGQNCGKKGYVNGFKTRVEKKQGKGDDTALNGLEVVCRSRKAKMKAIKAVIPPRPSTFKNKRIIAVNSKKCLDVPSGRKKNSIQIQQYRCHKGKNQRWNMNAKGQIISVATGKCLDIRGVSKKNRAAVQQYKCHSGKNQKWYLTKKGEIRSRLNNKCLDVKGYSKKNHGKIHMYGCHGKTNQRFSIK